MHITVNFRNICIKKLQLLYKISLISIYDYLFIIIYLLFNYKLYQNIKWIMMGSKYPKNILNLTF